MVASPSAQNRAPKTYIATLDKPTLFDAFPGGAADGCALRSWLVCPSANLALAHAGGSCAGPAQSLLNYLLASLYLTRLFSGIFVAAACQANYADSIMTGFLLVHWLQQLLFEVHHD